MTIIAAAKHNKEVYIGSDTLGSTMRFCQTYGDKLIYHKDFIVAFAGSYRGAQLVERTVHNIAGKPRDKQDVMEIAEFFKNIFEQVGVSSHSSGEFPSNETSFILATKDEVYMIENNYQVLVPEEGYIAAGSGEIIAIGTMYGLKNAMGKKISAKQMVSLAVKAAINHIPTCGGEVCIRKVTNNNLKHLKKK